MKTRFSIAALVFLTAMIFSFSSTASAYTMPGFGDFIDTSQKTAVNCDELKGDRTMVALVFGQSNSANHGETRYAPKGKVYNFFDGKCYLAADPLLGATGDRGSVWTRLGDMLVDQRLFDKVIIVSIGVGGTPMRRWTTNGDLHRRILDVITQLKKKNLKITHMLWHQGEADKVEKTTKDNYEKMFIDMLKDIRKHGVDAPIYVAVATRCGSSPADPVTQQAQRELVNTSLGIFPGPYTDELVSIEDRYDACHFSDAGLIKHAELWLNAIKLSGMVPGHLTGDFPYEKMR